MSDVGVPSPRDSVLSARSGVSPIMVGRAWPLARLVGIVEAAEVGPGTESAVALVSGEPGIGKTRLIDEFVHAVTAGNDPSPDVVVVRAEPGSLGRPYDAFAALSQDATDRAPGSPIGIGGEQDVEHAIVDLFEARLRVGTPLVLVAEDLHWIDAASASVVQALARQPWPSFVLIGTYRTGELRHGAPGGELVLRLERTHAVEQIRLQRLGRAEVDAMIAAITGAYPDSANVEAVWRRSDGVPYVIEELVRATQLDRSGDRVSAISSVELPWSLHDAIEQQLGNLSPSERLVAEALAVYNDPVSFEILAAITELDDNSLLEALRVLVANAVLREISDDRIWFDHALTADAIAQQLLSRERRQLHERCFRVLSAIVGGREVRAAQYYYLARHAVGAGRYGDVADIAREGAACALDMGATFLALRLAAMGLDEEPDDPDLLAVATEAAWRLDFLTEACDTAERWASVASGVALVEALRLQSRTWYERRKYKLGDDALNRLANLASDGSEPRDVRAAAAAGVAHLHMLAWRPQDSVDWADRAIAEATTIGDTLTIARASIDRASSLVDLAHPGRADAELERAIQLAREVDDPVALARGLNNLLCRVPPHTAHGRELLDELHAVAKGAGFDKLDAKGSGWERNAAFGVGDMASARRELDNAASSRVWSGMAEGWLTIDQAKIAVEEGRFDRAQKLLDEAAAAADDGEVVNRRQGEKLFDIHSTALMLAGFRGDRESGQAAYDRLLELPPPLCHWEMTDRLLGAIDAALSLGIAPAALRKQVLDDWLSDYPAVDQLRELVDGLLLLADNDPAGAVEALTPCVTAEWLQAPTRAGLKMTLARALIAVGERQRAIDVLDETIGHELARWPGVRRDRANELRRRLARSRPDRSHRAGDTTGDTASPNGGRDGNGTSADELTPREREVASLLAEGLTNGQVAERLYISPKTAAVHVSNILAKLGLSSRAEIAAWAVRNVLDADSAL